jgi:pSer/pThr/pTyr-binding forkhead associated (FHA) protein
MGALKDKTQLTAVVRQGPDAGSTFDLDHEETIIGRDSDCAIRLNDSAASRTHAVIRKQGQSYAISDLGSNNGTFVDGRKLSGMTIKHGDNIELGRTRLSVVSPAVAA